MGTGQGHGLWGRTGFGTKGRTSPNLSGIFTDPGRETMVSIPDLDQRPIPCRSVDDTTSNSRQETALRVKLTKVSTLVVL